MEELFKEASKKKFRFETPKGNLLTEDLWDLPLITKNLSGTSLDNLAKEINRQLKESTEESFVTETTAINSILEAKLDIIKCVIKEKLEDAKARMNRVARKEKKEKILSIIADKEDVSLMNNSIDDLKKMLSEL